MRVPVPCEGARRSARFPPGGGPRLGHGMPGGRAVVRRVGGVASARRRAAVAAGRDKHGCVRVAVCAVARTRGLGWWGVRGRAYGDAGGLGGCGSGSVAPVVEVRRSRLGLMETRPETAAPPRSSEKEPSAATSATLYLYCVRDGWSAQERGVIGPEQRRVSRL